MLHAVIHPIRYNTSVRTVSSMKYRNITEHKWNQLNELKVAVIVSIYQYILNLYSWKWQWETRRSGVTRMQESLRVAGVPPRREPTLPLTVFETISRSHSFPRGPNSEPPFLVWHLKVSTPKCKAH